MYDVLLETQRITNMEAVRNFEVISEKLNLDRQNYWVFGLCPSSEF
jgi:hypothetical protein